MGSFYFSTEDNAIIDDISQKIYHKEIVLNGDNHIMRYLDNFIPDPKVFKTTKKKPSDTESPRQFCDAYVKQLIIKKLVKHEFATFSPVWISMHMSFKQQTFMEAFIEYLKVNLYL